MNSESHVIFDLGNVLVDIHPEKTLEKLIEVTGFKSNHFDDFFLSDLHLKFMAGQKSPTEFYREFKRIYKAEIRFFEFTKIWKSLIGDSKVGISSIIHKLAEKNTLSLLSNTDPLHWRVARKNCPFLIDFNNYFLSYKLGVNKPSHVIYEIVLQQLKANPADCLFFDDSEENIIAARKAGIDAVLVTNAEMIIEALQHRKRL